MSLPLNATNSTSSTDDYDQRGAALYIAVILIWYSMGLALILFFQIRQRTFQNPSFHDPSKSHRLVHRFGHYDQKEKEILNELKDPERRQRLWKIYYSSKEKKDQPDPQYYQTINSDNITIEHIKRKLANFHRMDSRQREDFSLSPSNETSKFFSKRFVSSRRPMEVSTTQPLLRLHSQPTPTGDDDDQAPTTKSISRFTVEKVSTNEK